MCPEADVNQQPLKFAAAAACSVLKTFVIFMLMSDASVKF